MPLVTLRPQAVADFIARPGEAAEVQRLSRLGQLDQGFQLPLLREALNHGIAVKEDRIVFLQRHLRPQAGCRKT